MNEKAEDLWNEDDGPLKPLPPSPANAPVDRTKLKLEHRDLSRHGEPVHSVNAGSSYPLSPKPWQRNYSVQNIPALDGRNMGNVGGGPLVNAGSSLRPRSYSARARRKFQGDEDSSDSDSDYALVKPFVGKDARTIGNPKWPRLVLTAGKFSDEHAELRGKENVKKMSSSAALGKYDNKKTRRVPPHLVEKLASEEEVDVIRYELQKRISQKNIEEKTDTDTNSMLSEKRFDESPISPLTVKALTSAGYVQMTRVQDATLTAFLDGKDALVKAKTGTGKSMAFLIPVIESVLKALSDRITGLQPIYALIICPTRELAIQLVAEGTALVKYHDNIHVQALIGGTRLKVDQKVLESGQCQIIVATPGRLLDHIENKSGISVRLMGLKVLVLDEADHLLDLGFRKDVETIVDCLPRKRQSLLFSATIPKEVQRISQLVLKRDHAYIDMVGFGCLETHTKVKQSCLIAPHELHFQIVHHLLEEHIYQTSDYKVIVFCTTGMVASLMFQLFREMKLNVREIHSRKPQLFRTRVSDEFKESNRLILISSDVSSRGIHYPDVTLVMQMGIPPDREQYIHRLGRTGREDKDGQGILLLAPWEEYFLDEIKDLPIEKLSSPRLNPKLKLKMDNSMTMVETRVKEAAYHAWLGYYNSIREIGRDKTTLAELANAFGRSIGLPNPPTLFRKTALKMGLSGIPGIRIRK